MIQQLHSVRCKIYLINLHRLAKLQEILKGSGTLHVAERLKEWKERKLIRNEDENLQVQYLKEQSKTEGTQLWQTASPT